MPEYQQREARRARRVPHTALAVAAGALLMTSCTASPGSTREVHADGEGPLSASIGVGGNSIRAPKAATWTGTFGGYVLCGREPGTRIEVQRIRYEASIEPVKVVPTVRTTSPESLRRLGPALRQEHLPTYAALGSPPQFAEPYVGVVVPGDYSTQVRGWQVNESCEQTAALERQLSEGQIPNRALKELMFVVTASSRGAKIEQVDIDYLADGRPKTLELHWTMVSCGSATIGPDTCRH